VNKKRNSGYAALKKLSSEPRDPAKKSAKSRPYTDRAETAAHASAARAPRSAKDVSQVATRQTSLATATRQTSPADQWRTRAEEREFGAKAENTASVQRPPTPVQKLTIDESADGQRIDNYLLRVLKGAPRNLIYRILSSGEVRVNSGRAKPTQRLHVGDVVRVPPVRLGEAVSNAPEANQVDWLKNHLIAQERELIVINKPSGLASHGGSGISFGAIEALRVLYPHDTLELVHRLDRDTSGLMLIARKRQTLVQLQSTMKQGGMRKRYLTLVVGVPKEDRFDCKLSLRKFELAGGERVVKISDDGKPSLTYFKVLERFPEHGLSLLEATLGTGRTHQIRVHAQGSGYPVAGDSKYGDNDANLRLQKLGLRRLFLHAARLQWKHDDGSGNLIPRDFQAELPTDLEQLLSKLRQSFVS
jgi:23S rRNA pseudouridine955/2504/2580 synthase